MRRITRDYTVPQDKRHEVREPAARVQLGEAFVVETINYCTSIIRKPEDVNPEDYKEREETGPIYVEGIAAGDVLSIRIDSIRPEGHAGGGPANDPERGSFLELRDGKVHFPGGLVISQRMMIGDIRVQPQDTKGNNPWDYGGNMDFKDICAGNTLMFKAELDGGLLVLGDLHAAQGDGEIGGLGAECAGEVTLTIEKETEWPVVRPTIRKEKSFVSLACREDYTAAKNLAVADATRILAKVKGCSEGEAKLFVNTVGELRNGAVWSMGETEPDWIKTLPLVVGVEVPLA